MPAFENDAAAILVIGAGALFWIGMLGLLWRRSLVGMLVGIFCAWLSVAMCGIGFIVSGFRPEGAAAGGIFVLGVIAICSMQLVIGLGVVVARIRRRGTLDADDAGLLEG